MSIIEDSISSEKPFEKFVSICSRHSFKFDELVNLVNEYKKKNPDHFNFTLTAGNVYDDQIIEVKCWRYETEKEIKTRIANAKEYDARLKERELKELERLTNKYKTNS
jgi:hypothetical protein